MTLHLSFPSMYKSGIKVPFENKIMGLTHQSLVSPCHSLSLSLADAVSSEGTPGSCWGWTPAVGHWSCSYWESRYAENVTRVRAQKACLWEFPNCPVVKNPPCKAGVNSSITRWGTMSPDALRQLSPSVSTTEPLEAISRESMHCN